jgi:hypothetical protein
MSPSGKTVANGPRAGRSGQRAEPAVTELDRFKLAMNLPSGPAVPTRMMVAKVSLERQIPMANSLLIYLIPLRPARPSGPLARPRPITPWARAIFQPERASG